MKKVIEKRILEIILAFFGIVFLTFGAFLFFFLGSPNIQLKIQLVMGAIATLAIAFIVAMYLDKKY
ncbi:MAG: hypothetical protein ABIF08_04870 [Nanoarchaeota archaeon]